MKVLVTGGAGFIGSHVVERLIEEDNDVTVLDNMSSGKLTNLNHYQSDNKLRIEVGDIRNTKLVSKCVASADSVVHLAAITNSPDQGEKLLNLTDTNVTGTVNLLQAARLGSVERFILASSAAVYGNSKSFPLSERSRTSALSPYGASKIASEQYCHSFREEFGVNAISLRFFNVYGPRQLPNGDGAVIPQFMSRLVQRLPPEIFGDGRQTRDFVYVSDVVECIVRILRSKTGEEVLNVGSGKPVTINRLASVMSRIVGSSAKPIHKAPQRGEIRDSYASTARTFESIDFRPRISLKRGLSLLVQSYNGSGFLKEPLA